MPAFLIPHFFVCVPRAVCFVPYCHCCVTLCTFTAQGFYYMRTCCHVKICFELKCLFSLHKKSPLSLGLLSPLSASGPAQVTSDRGDLWPPGAKIFGYFPSIPEETQRKKERESVRFIEFSRQACWTFNVLPRTHMWCPAAKRIDKHTDAFLS